MANRLTKIYTRTGDTGTTGLADGSRMAKDAPRIEAIGTVDELNSAVGVLLAEDLPAEVHTCLEGVQHDLFDLGGELSVPGHAIMSEAHSKRLEEALDAFNAKLPSLKEFILPGGSRVAGLAHVARTVCRRAERRLVSLSQREPVSPLTLQYLNRLSDLLFVLARALNRHAGRGDVLWQQGKNRGKTKD
jgi:cob(I)alamin adenosyltransferase